MSSQSNRKLTALVSLYSPVDGNPSRGTLSYVSFDSLTVTHAVSTEITTTSVKQTVLVVWTRVHDRVASFKYLVVYQPD